MKGQNKSHLQKRIFSLFMAIALMFTSLYFDLGDNTEAIADENPTCDYSISYGAPMGTASEFYFPKAKITGNNGVTTATSMIFSLSTGYIVDYPKNDTTAHVLQDLGTPVSTGSTEKKHQAVMWYWDSPKSLEDISAILSKIKFEYTSGMKVEVTIDGNKTDLRGATSITFLKHDWTADGTTHIYDGDGQMHYYVYIPTKTSWDNAYNGAKSLYCLGLRGYLSTATDTLEDKVYDNISNTEAWAGGARAYNTKNIPDSASFNDCGIPDTVPNSDRSSWKWACGPEAGLQIPNKHLKSNGTSWYNGESLVYIDKIDEGYGKWNDTEPNNSDNREWALEVHFGEQKKWNDYPLDSTIPSGYFVEFSNYDKLIYNPEVKNTCYMDGYNPKATAFGSVTISDTEEHVWDFENAPGEVNKIQAKCVETKTEHSNCAYHDKTADFSIITKDKQYDGEPIKEPELEGDFFDVVNFLGYEISPFEYEGINGTEYSRSDKLPVNAGEYKAIVKIKNKNNTSDPDCEAYSTFSIYSGTVSAYADPVVKEYDGNSYGIDVKIDFPLASECTVYYGEDANNITDTQTPKYSEGVHTVWYKVTSKNCVPKTGNTTVTIKPHDIDKVTIDADFVYDGQPHSMIIDYPKDRVDKILYSKSETGPFTEEVPTYKDAYNGIIYVKLIPKDANVNLEKIIPVDFVIAKKELVVDETKMQTELEYNGFKQAPDVIFSGQVGNDSVNVLPQYDNANNYKDAGVRSATYIVDNNNYYLSTDTIDYIIKPKKIKVKAQDTGKKVEEPDPELKYIAEGIAKGDTLKDINITRENGEKAGTYKITVSGDSSSNPNYDITYENAVFTIEDHEIVIDPGKNATCTEDGITEGSHCSVCNKIIKKQEVIPAIGHDYTGEWIVVKEPTETESGKKVKKCKNGCNSEISEVIPPLGTEEEPDPNAGKVSKIAEVEPESPVEEAELENTKSELLSDDKIFTNEDIGKIDNGQDAKVWMIVDKVKDENLSEKDIDEIERVANKEIGNSTKLTFVDITLYKQIGNEKKEIVEETKNDIVIKLAIPEELKNKDNSKTRVYSVICYHKNVATNLNVMLTSDKTHIEFRTNKFSTYAIGYKDIPAGLVASYENGAAVKLDKKVHLYTGDEIRPKVTAEYYYPDSKNILGKTNKLKKIKLKENVDYVVEYENNIQAGTGSVIVRGIGDFSFSVTKKFSILKRRTVNWKIRKMPKFYANGTDLSEDIKAAVRVYYKGKEVDKSEYFVNLEGDTVNPGKVSISVSTNGLYNFFGNEVVKTKIKISGNTKVDFSKVTVEVVGKKPIKYNGKALKPKVIVKMGEKKIKKNRYSVVYYDNVNAGTGYVQIIGKGKSAGVSEKIPFTIEPGDFSKIKVKKCSDAYWRNDLNQINPEVKIGNKYLKKDIDYVIESTDLDDPEFIAGFDKERKIKAKIVLKPLNPNFVLEDTLVTKSIYISKRNIKSQLKTKVKTSVEYIDSKYVPSVELAYINDSLVEGKDYTVKYKISTKKKTGETIAKATIKGIGLYTGQRVVTWTIGQDL